VDTLGVGRGPTLVQVVSDAFDVEADYSRASHGLRSVRAAMSRDFDDVDAPRQDNDSSPMTRRQIVTASLAWLTVVGIGWWFFGGTPIAPCFSRFGPGWEAALERCSATYFAAHPPPPHIDAPLFWLGVLAVGLGVTWTLALRRARYHTSTAPLR
jgi:hypothetical protein